MGGCAFGHGAAIAGGICGVPSGSPGFASSRSVMFCHGRHAQGAWVVGLSGMVPSLRAGCAVFRPVAPALRLHDVSCFVMVGMIGAHGLLAFQAWSSNRRAGCAVFRPVLPALRLPEVSCFVMVGMSRAHGRLSFRAWRRHCGRGVRQSVRFPRLCVFGMGSLPSILFRSIPPAAASPAQRNPFSRVSRARAPAPGCARFAPARGLRA